MNTRLPPKVRVETRSAFTMIEIAISLAVIGFALIAVVGVMPIGMKAQQQNREETIINQDASILMEAMRNGARGLDDLTNYVLAITNYATEYHTAGKNITYVRGYTPVDSSTSPSFPLISGERIVGLLSTPKYIPFSTGKDTGFVSNYIVAYLRSLSGTAAEKTPQTNQTMREMAFSYRLVPEIVPFTGFDSSWVNYTDPNLVHQKNTNEIAARSNYWMYVRNLQTNVHDLRLLFRWPLLANGKTGRGRQVFRTMASGSYWVTNELLNPARSEFNLYFLQPRTYVKAP